MEPSDTTGHDHPGNPHLRKFNSAMKVARGGQPSSTMVSTSDSAPILTRGSVGRATGAYAAFIAEQLPKDAPPKVGMRLMEFFCCGGGIGLGFRSAGYDLAFANDIDHKAAATYGKNLGHAPVVRDIREVGPGDFGEVKPDVLTGGFPCVTFSMAGKRMGVTDDVHGKLYLELCRVIREARPRYFVAENVEGMLSANGGKAVKLVLAEFLRLGYRTSYELVNMAEHGVPQTRKRVIFVGVRLDQWRGSFVFPKKTHRLAGDKRADKWLPPARSLREAIGDLPPPGERIDGATNGANGYRAKSAREGRKTSERPVHVVVQATAQNSKGSRVRSAEGPACTMTGNRNSARVGSHERNDAPVYEKYGMSRRVARAGKPAPTMTSNKDAGFQVDAPWIAGHERNDSKVSPTHQMSKRIAKPGEPAPTCVSEAANVQPFIVAGRNPDFANPLRKAGDPGVTMTSNGSAEAALSDGTLRRMTVRECARVQSFPDWYEFQGTMADGYAQVGNAVPPLYAKRLARAILDYDKRELVKR